MGFSMRTGNIQISDFSKHWRQFLLWGIALSILGIAAMSTATFTTLISVFLIGILLTISGIVIIINSFSFWRGRPGFTLHLLSGILYAGIGVMLIVNPVSGAASLTLLLGIGFTLVGIFRIISALSLKLFQWQLSLFNGLLTLLIGTLIMRSWPESSLYIIGLFIGIDLLICGWVYIMSAMAARNYLKND